MLIRWLLVLALILGLLITALELSAGPHARRHARRPASVADVVIGRGEEAQNAFRQLNGDDLDGGRIPVEVPNPQARRRGGGGGGGRRGGGRPGGGRPGGGGGRESGYAHRPSKRVKW